MARICRLIAGSLATALVAAAPPALAQNDIYPIPELKKQLDEALRDLTDQFEPVLEDLLDRLDVLDKIDSFENYNRPEVLPNGDIIIRRREDAPEYIPPEPDIIINPEDPGTRT
ncbi:hypothetical protein KHP62_00935 [Rhodobacteraceae bacterium NNCM2]|nr:hypothetical protein [Coraliihabitans acroporae]